MVGRVLNQCGLDLGPPDELLGPHKDNLFGYFENRSFLEIDEALLEHYGGSWDNPPGLKNGWEHDAGLDQIRCRAQELINRFNGSPHWGWKQPRATVLVPFWKALIPDVRFVICIRNPLDVAKSLAKRDVISILQGTNLWSRYMHAVIRDTEGSPRVFTFYEDYFNGDQEIKRVVEFCGLPWHEKSSTHEGAVVPEVKHHSSDIWDLLADDNAVVEAKALYIGLRAILCEGHTHTPMPLKREAWISETVSRYGAMIREWAEGYHTSRLESALIEKDKQIAELCHTIEAERDAREEELRDSRNEVSSLKAERDHLLHEQEHLLRGRAGLLLAVDKYKHYIEVSEKVMREREANHAKREALLRGIIKRKQNLEIPRDEIHDTE
jgi:hypothetical protein